MRRLLFLNKDAGSPLCCLGTNTTLWKTCELDVKTKNYTGLLAIVLLETLVLVYGVLEMGGGGERTRQLPVWLRMNCIASATAYQLGLGAPWP